MKNSDSSSARAYRGVKPKAHENAVLLAKQHQLPQLLYTQNCHQTTLYRFCPRLSGNRPPNSRREILFAGIAPRVECLRKFETFTKNQPNSALNPKNHNFRAVDPCRHCPALTINLFRPGFPAAAVLDAPSLSFTFRYRRIKQSAQYSPRPQYFCNSQNSARDTIIENNATI